MSDNVRDDQLVVVRIVGMHCHKCEDTIRKSLLKVAGVHEVEVDFPTGQASILFNPSEARISELLDAVKTAGYQAAGFSERVADSPSTRQ